jgi:DNA-binding response OmpR family regulator
MKHSKGDRKRILVVEDEPTISQMCQRTLTDEGFDVDIAVNGAIAQDMSDEKEHDLYLIDIRTPVMNGNELYQHIREKHPELTDKVIFTTGDVLDEELAVLLKGTKRQYLPKPFTPDELRTIVRETLGQTRG